MLRLSFYDCLLFCFYFTRLYAHKLIAVLLVEPALVSPVSVFPLFIIEENLWISAQVVCWSDALQVTQPIM